MRFDIHLLTICRIAHRLRDMQTLPFVVVTNPHISHVYELYYKAFETFRRVEEIKTVDDNDRYCAIISKTLQEHLTVIPRLAMGVIECQGHDACGAIGQVHEYIAKIGELRTTLPTIVLMLNSVSHGA